MKSFTHALSLVVPAIFVALTSCIVSGCQTKDTIDEKAIATLKAFSTSSIKYNSAWYWPHECQQDSPTWNEAVRICKADKAAHCNGVKLALESHCGQ